MTATEFWIRCRTCDGDGQHGWVSLPTQATRGRWAAEHKAETGHEEWQLHDGPMGKLTAELHRKLGQAYDNMRVLLDTVARQRGLDPHTNDEGTSP